jgi:predicted ATPase
LAAVYQRRGHAEEGLQVVAEALARVDKTGGRLWEAELYRLKGELILQARGQSAEACFQHAIAIARKQQAKSLELRAVLSLSRLWQQQGKRDEARQMLAEIYGWFTEGFDTKDLQEAKTLLEELT